jgi:hypothetical protein
MAFDKLKNLFNVDIKDGLPGKAVVQSSSVPTEAARPVQRQHVAGRVRGGPRALSREA